MDKILITGANGYLAKFIIDLLKHGSAELVALVKPESVFNQNENKFSKVYYDLDSLLAGESRFSKIFHLAAFIPYGKTNVPNREFINTNILQTTRLVCAYPDAFFVYTSSVAVYGNPKVLPLTIESPLAEVDLYGLSKLAGEAAVKNQPHHGIIRFASIIGPGMKMNSFVPKIIEQASTTGLIRIFGDGSRMQNYIDVRDAARLCVTCSGSDNNVITIGVSDRSYSNREVAGMVAQITGARVEFSGTDAGFSFCYDNGDLYDHLHFRPAYQLEQTLQDMIKS